MMYMYNNITYGYDYSYIIKKNKQILNNLWPHRYIYG
jgi:hypothetical protein